MTTPLVQLFEAIELPLRGLLCTALPNAVDRALINIVAPAVGASLAPDLINWLQPATCAAPPPQDGNPGMFGGQCSTFYRVRSVATLVGGETRAISWGNLQGPILGIRMTWQPNPFFNEQYALAQVLSTDATQPGGVRVNGFGPIGNNDPNRVARHYFTEISRVDGLPDNCGDRPPAPPNPPPSYPELPIPPFNITINGTTINITAFATFAPAINMPIYGGVHIPVTVRINPTVSIPVGVRIPVYLRLPGLTINQAISGINVNVQPTINFPSGGSSEIDYVERIIGVRTTTTLETPSRISLIAGNESGSDLLVPWAGMIRFVPPAFAASVESIEVPIKTANQYVPCPWFYGADSFTLIENVGASITAVPVRALVADFYKPV